MSHEAVWSQRTRRGVQRKRRKAEATVASRLRVASTCSACWTRAASVGFAPAAASCAISAESCATLLDALPLPRAACDGGQRWPLSTLQLVHVLLVNNGPASVAGQR